MLPKSLEQPVVEKSVRIVTCDRGEPVERRRGGVERPVERGDHGERELLAQERDHGESLELLHPRLLHAHARSRPERERRPGDAVDLDWRIARQQKSSASWATSVTSPRSSP